MRKLSFRASSLAREERMHRRERERQVFKALKPYLSSRSMWRGYWYAKGAVGKWNRASQVTEGMRWNHYMSSGRGTPFFAMHEEHRAPPLSGAIESHAEASKSRRREALAPHGFVRNVATADVRAQPAHAEAPVHRERTPVNLPLSSGEACEFEPWHHGQDAAGSQSFQAPHAVTEEQVHGTSRALQAPAPAIVTGQGFALLIAGAPSNDNAGGPQHDSPAEDDGTREPVAAMMALICNALGSGIAVVTGMLPARARDEDTAADEPRPHQNREPSIRRPGPETASRASGSPVPVTWSPDAGCGGMAMAGHDAGNGRPEAHAFHPRRGPGYISSQQKKVLQLKVARADAQPSE
ncbi:MAG: hypothetical protein AB1529_07500 [Candidatus Micrarchaeota archaeon]